MVALTLLAFACDGPTASLDGPLRKGTSSGTPTGGEDGGGTSSTSSGGTSSGGGADASTTTSSSGGTGPSTGSDKPNCKYTAHKTGLTTLQQAGGLSFTTYVPASYDKSVGHAVVIIMHGQDSNGVPELQALWQALADQESLILLAPKGSRPATNGDPNAGNWAVDDLNHVQDLMGEIDDCYDVLAKKHILWGFSEGGFYGYLLGIGAANQFSGLAMGGSNTSFARQNGFAPANAQWKIPVSHVHGDQDFNPISVTLQDQTDFQAAGHVFTLHEHPGGHTITADQVKMQYDDLKASTSP